jgi:DNA mismatch repair protein MutS
MSPHPVSVHADTDRGWDSEHEWDRDPVSVSLLGPAATLNRPPVGQGAYLADLNLEQLVASIRERAADPDSTAFLLVAPLADAETVYYRQEVFADLADPELRKSALQLTVNLNRLRGELQTARQIDDPLERQGWLLDSACRYCDAVDSIIAALQAASISSAALTDLTRALLSYQRSDDFASLRADATGTREALSAVGYCLHLRGRIVEVSRYRGQPDYSQQISEVFSRFQQDPPHDYLLTYRFPPVLGNVGTNILALVAKLFPDEFARLARFCQDHPDFTRPQITGLESELDFYLSYLDHIDTLQASGLRFCYPTIALAHEGESADNTFDIVLAAKLAKAGQTVVNSFELRPPERIFVVSGPNQGGKTTFARTFGQLHHLAAVGCPIPGTAATIGLASNIYTHFQQEEHIVELKGRLHSDLERIHQIISAADEGAVVIINELFSSATLQDARYLGTQIMQRLIAIGARCAYVTFVDELAATGPEVVSLTSNVNPADPVQRTFKIARAPANGIAYALALAEKHDLTYDRLTRLLER